MREIGFLTSSIRIGLLRNKTRVFGLARRLLSDVPRHSRIGIST
jgi:hypothetical protein